MTWRLAHGRAIGLDRPRIIAILNATPDSFFDGGRLTDAAAARDAAVRAAGEGADALDLGGESTRPGASRVPADEQLRRILPALRAIRGALPSMPISIDTTLVPVAAGAIEAGADAINDVSAGTEDPGMFALAARAGAGLVLMHRLRPPGEDSYSDRYASPPSYMDVVASVRSFLADRAAVAAREGVPKEGIVLDPGLGFGKSVEQNLELVRRTGELTVLGFPVLSAASRKSFVGRAGMPGRETGPEDRLAATLGISVAHLAAGARLFRVHDVRAHAEALRAAWEVIRGREPQDEPTAEP